METDVPLASWWLKSMHFLQQDDGLFFIDHDMLHHEFCGLQHVTAPAHKLPMNANCNMSHLIMREVKKIRPPNLKLYIVWIFPGTVGSKIHFMNCGPESTLFKAFYHNIWH